MPSQLTSNQTGLDIEELRKACSQCSLVDLCLPVGLKKDELTELDTLVESLGPLHGGHYLYREGDPFKALYAVRSGYLKTYTVDEEGNEQVLGFFLPGELVGLEAIYPEQHQCSAVVLDTAMICRISFERLNQLSIKIPALQKQILRLMSLDINRSQSLSGDHTAEERVAAFLISLSRRLEERGYSPNRYLLAMSRRDIANLLRLATETVSRVFSRFQEQGMIVVERREVQLLDKLKLNNACRRMHQI